MNEYGLYYNPVNTIEKNGSFVKLLKGSIVKFEGDCIVNAANTGGLGGGGVDGAISDAGGEELYQARKNFPIIRNNIRINIGDSKSTKAFGDLKCKYVIHTVGPDFRETNDISILKKAYISALKESHRLSCKTIGFSLLSSGIFKGNRSLEEVLQVGLETILNNTKLFKNAYLIAYSTEEYNILEKLMKKYQ